MSKWEEFQIEDKVIEILRDIPISSNDPEHCFTFISAYQLAIEFSKRYPDDFMALNTPIGGKGVGQYNSLTQYLSKQLIQKIRSEEIKQIEMRFLSNWHLNDISFKHDHEVITSTLTDTGYSLSLFRLIR